MGSSNAKYLYRLESGLAEKNQVDSEVTTSQQRAHAAKTNGVLGCISQKYHQQVKEGILSLHSTCEAAPGALVQFWASQYRKRSRSTKTIYCITLCFPA